MAELPSDIQEAANKARLNLLPSLSKAKYDVAYNQFQKWKMENKIYINSEDVLLAYFSKLKEKYAPPTLWSIFSMLKAELNVNDGINIAKYPGLETFLKNYSKGYVSKKSKVLEAEHIHEFLDKACDTKYLATKVATIIGFYGACRRNELYNLKCNDVKEEGQVFTVKITKTKNHVHREFLVNGPYTNFIKKYINLRPANASSDNFFLNYQNGQCRNQVIGINKFGAMPKAIAEFLNLPDAKSYTGHAFRRSCATALANAGANFLTIKRHGGWKSSAVAETYIDNCKKIKENVGNMMTSTITSNAHPATVTSAVHSDSNSSIGVMSDEQSQEFLDNDPMMDYLETKTSNNMPHPAPYVNSRQNDSTQQFRNCTFNFNVPKNN